MKAIGLIEALGLTTAVAAVDAASKAADVTLVGMEKIIGVGSYVGVNIQVAGEVAAVQAAVDAGTRAGNNVGRVFSSHVIPRPHDEVDLLIKKFEKNLNIEKEEKVKKKEAKKNNKTNKEE